jgi:hypothetical protein
MTLKELHKRLGVIIFENEARGWSDRNDQTVIIEITPPSSRKRSRRSRYLKLQYASSATMGIAGQQYMSISARSDDEIPLATSSPKRSRSPSLKLCEHVTGRAKAHTCPYKEDVENDHTTKCRCCETCQKTCEKSI